MTEMLERRKTARQRVLKGGKVFYSNYAVSVDCVIRNESEDGLQIKLDPNIAIPKDLSLLNRKDGTLAEAHVVWQQGETVGLKLSTKMKDVREFSKSDIRRMSIIATRG